MFDQHMICEETLRNLREDAVVTGFAFDVRITTYRGLRLSLVEPFDVVVDGVEIPSEDVLFQLRGRRYSIAEMAREVSVRWEFGERATLVVRRPGGLSPGSHEIELTETLRISYMPVPSVTRSRKLAELNDPELPDPELTEPKMQQQ